MPDANPVPAVIVPVDTNPPFDVNNPTSVEAALGISQKRMRELAWLTTENLYKGTKADGLIRIAECRELTDREKAYCAYKLYGWILQREVPPIVSRLMHLDSR